MWTVYFLHTGLTPRMKLYTKETALQWKEYFDTPAPEVCYKVDYTFGFAADSRLDVLYINERDYQGETFNGFKKIDSVFIYESGDFSGWWYLVTDRGYRNTANGGEHWFALAFDAFMSGTYDINGKLEQGQIDNTETDAFSGAEQVETEERTLVATGNAFDGILIGTSVHTNIFTKTGSVPTAADGLSYYAIYFSKNSGMTFGNFQNAIAIKSGEETYYPLRTDGVKFILPIRENSCVSTGVLSADVSTGFEDRPTIYYEQFRVEPFKGLTRLSKAAKSACSFFRATPFVGGSQKAPLLVPVLMDLYGIQVNLPSPTTATNAYNDISVEYYIDFQGALTLSGDVKLLNGETVVSVFQIAGKVGTTYNVLNAEGSAILLNQRQGYYEGLLTQLGTGIFGATVRGDIAGVGGAVLSAVPSALSAYKAKHRVKEQGVATYGGTYNTTRNGECFLSYEPLQNNSELVKDWNLHGYHHPSRAYRWNGDHSVSTVVPRNVYVFRRFSEVNVTPRALTDSSGLAPVDWCRDVEQMFIDGAYLFKALNETTVSRGRFVYLIEGLSETRVNSNGGG